MSQRSFPPHPWPPCCPPSGAYDATGTVYRIVKSNPFTEDDLKTHAELRPSKGKESCGRCGLSVLLTEEDAELHHVNWPSHGNFVAKGDLWADHGKMQIVGGSEDSHSNIWFYQEITAVARMSIFTYHKDLTS